MGFFLLLGINRLGNLHQDELAIAAVFRVQAHHGFGGGAAAAEEVQRNCAFVAGACVAQEASHFVHVFGVVEDVFTQQLAQVAHRHLRLFVKVAAAHLGGEFVVRFSIRISVFGHCVNFLRQRANVRLAKRRLGMVVAEGHQAQIDLSLHFVGIGVNPASLWDLAG